MGSVGRILSCAETSFFSFFRSKNVFWLIMFPLTVTIVLGSLVAVTDESNENIRYEIYVQDKCGSGTSQSIIDTLSEKVTVYGIDPSEDIDGYRSAHPDRPIMVIPENFNRWIAHGAVFEEYPVTLYVSGTEYRLNVMGSASSDDAPTVVVPDMPAVTDLVDTVLSGDSDNPYKNYFATIVVLCVMQIIISNVLTNELNDRSSNISKLMPFTKLKNWEREMSQILWALVPAAVCFAVCYAAMCLFSVVDLGIDAFATLMLFCMTMVPISLILSKVVPGQQSVSLISALLAVVMIEFSGGIYPLSMMPETFQTISEYLPTTYCFEGLRSYGGNFDLLRNSSVLIAMFAVYSAIWLVWDTVGKRKLR